MIKFLRFFLAIAGLAAILTAATRHRDDVVPVDGTHVSIATFRDGSKIFAAKIDTLKKIIQNLDTEKQENATDARKALTDCRLSYKRIEAFLEYFFRTSSRIYNRAPKHEVEEPYIEYQEPAGLQVIEAILYEEHFSAKKAELVEQINLLSLAANDLPALVYNFKGTNNQILESHRLELIRIITFSISGFDAPLLKTGITEAQEALTVMQKTLAPYLRKQDTGSDSVNVYLSNSLSYLEIHSDFDSFDRLAFLTDHVLPLQKHLGVLIRALNLDLNSTGILNYEAENLFSPNAFNVEAFDGVTQPPGRDLVSLGKRLFSEQALSGNSKMSCATCHNPDHFFTDGLPKSLSGDGKTSVRRNAPSLLYASFQHNQFWDGREGSLDAQIENVMKSTLEMAADPAEIVKRLKKIPTYKRQFKKSFATDRNETITEKNIYHSLSAYVRTLSPRNSAFDRYMQGNRLAMTATEVNGFNLFMGKAQCGTCHFAPLFNGLIPPSFSLTEFEILGTTAHDDLTKAEPDSDNGRFDLYPTAHYKGAFKTPTVRNAAKTGPYMHNGAFGTLETLMEFYNQGGGAGLGLDIPNQTLSSAKLNLSENEKNDIIGFLNALTDQPLTNYK